MPQRKPRHTTGCQATPNKQRPATENETTASQARRTAERIGRLGEEVLASFRSSDAGQRLATLQHVETEILLDMLPVIGWLERRRPADTAELVKRRMNHVLREAVRCAGLDIPEYAGGTVARITGEPSLGATRTATLVVTAKVFADSLRQWADDIEAEDETMAPPTEKTHPDGPEGGRWVWWNNQRHGVPEGNVYRMIAYMWDRDSASYDDLIGPVFDDPVDPQTIRSCANKVKNALLPTGVPWRLKTDSVNRFITKNAAK